jgi:hypothetical protein
MVERSRESQLEQGVVGVPVPAEGEQGLGVGPGSRGFLGILLKEPGQVAVPVQEEQRARQGVGTPWLSLGFSRGMSCKCCTASCPPWSLSAAWGLGEGLRGELALANVQPFPRGGFEVTGLARLFGLRSEPPVLTPPQPTPARAAGKDPPCVSGERPPQPLPLA